MMVLLLLLIVMIHVILLEVLMVAEKQMFVLVMVGFFEIVDVDQCHFFIMMRQTDGTLLDHGEQVIEEEKAKSSVDEMTVFSVLYKRGFRVRGRRSRRRHAAFHERLAWIDKTAHGQWKKVCRHVLRDHMDLFRNGFVIDEEA